ncbi:hypothetical protein CSB20_08430 [bacterium DOLZORAL124_64_63]|nr:MAG: hypothetical protein CSB20_08430 [bacterium DOLZORAL124_64_63]
MPLSRPDTRPDVSVVIPVFNKLEMTRVCVESILEHGAQALFEIIVVSNGSTDGTDQWLTEQSRRGHLKAVLNQRNEGFSAGCNTGAAAASGRYILFLNNDMEVTPDWLDPMVTTLDNDPAVGIVGARLLFPDGTIQHGGVALVQKTGTDGTPHIEGIHVGYRMDGASPGNNTPRHMQIVTGAALLIRREVFTEVGGFDTGYWNGNEDVDLCLKAGEKGWQTVYRPESVIYHFESQSGPERWTAVQENVRRFNTIWQGRAQPDMTQPPSGKALQATKTNRIRTYTPPRVRRPATATRASDSVSIIVLTWNALDYTRRCAESLLRHTDPRHEILFVDNGSRADTIAYLQDLERDHAQVRVILNGENLGFAGGNNVGLAAARGRHVCLLNSDTVVTAGWLDPMVRVLDSDPRVGLVGPMTNSITGPQKLDSVPYDEETLDGLDEFAAQLAERLGGQVVPTLWVVGFCVLIRGALLEQIGGLDTSFGQGNFEDTDYCLRAFIAGQNSVIVPDSFVHHFGSRSFAAGRVDYHALMAEKKAIFQSKWAAKGNAPGELSIDPEFLISQGFVAPLHFHPLPGLENLPLWEWEKRQWLAKGEQFFQREHFDGAARIFQRLLDFCPGHPQAINNLACSLWRLGRVAEAVNLLEKLLREHPENEDARWNLEQIAPKLQEST